MPKPTSKDLVDYLRKLAADIENNDPQVFEISIRTGERDTTEDGDVAKRYEPTGERWVSLHYWLKENKK